MNCYLSSNTLFLLCILNYDKILKNKSSKKHSRIPSNLFYFHFINAWNDLFCPFVKVFDII